MITDLVWKCLDLVGLILDKYLRFPFRWEPHQKRLMCTSKGNFAHLLKASPGVLYIMIAETTWIMHLARHLFHPLLHEE